MKKFSDKLNQFFKRFKRGNSGSITLFVLIALIFFITVGLGIYISTSNTLNSQSKEVSKMEGDYQVGDDELDEIYEDIITDETSNMHIILIKPSDESIYIEGTWANEDLLLIVRYPEDVAPEDQYVYIDGEKIKYEEGMMIDESCVIEIDVWGRTDSTEAKIDKVPPTVTYNPNGGIYGVDDQDKTADIRTQVTIDDLDGDGKKDNESEISGPNLEFEYVWSTKNEKPTDGWQISTSGSEVVKEDATEGVYYLWVRAKDKAGNETIEFSKPFTVKKAEQLITIDPNPKTLTKDNVIAKITWHELLTDKKYAWGKTLEEAKQNLKDSSNSIYNLTVTENGFVYAEGRDTNGKLITKSCEITNIDKYPPVYDRVEVKNVTTTGYDIYVYGVKDVGVAGMDRVQFPTWAEMNGNRTDIPSDWETNTSLKGELQSDGTTWKYHVDNSKYNNAYGKFHTEVYIYDKVGNRTKVEDDSLENIQVPGIKITYDYKTNGGTSATKTTDTIKRDSQVDLKPTATKPGWVFVGWNTDKNANKGLTSLKAGTKDITLYAIFSKTYKVTFTYYEGTAQKNQVVPITIWNTATSGKINTPSVTGTYSDYTKNGWTLSKDPTTTAGIGEGAEITVNADTTYYMLYKKTIYATLYTYNNQSTKKSGTIAANSANIGNILNANIALGTTSLSGYNFRGWSTAKEANAGITINANGTASIKVDTSYYASYTYTVTGTYKYYNGSAYTSSTANATAYMNYVGSKVGGTPTAPTTKTPSGWTNRGWSTDPSSQATVATPGPITSNTTYYYSWQKGVTATLYYYNNQKTTKAGTAYMDYAGTVTKAGLNLGTITLSGYTFRGWSTAKEANANITVKPNGVANIQENTTYYGSYTYTVTATYKYYNGSAYTSSSANATAYMNYVGSKVGGTPSVPTVSTPSGWSNRGWSTDTSPSATTKAPGAITANTTYYYSWQKTVIATLKTYNNQTSTKNGTAYLNYEGKITNANINLGTSSVSGYSFRGWSTDTAANAKITIAANGTASINANTTYYGSYTYGITATLKTYNNKTSTKEGSAYMSYNGTKVNGTINLGTTSLNGYTFRGWSTSNAANASITVQANGNANIQADTTFYASYTYTVTATLKTYNNQTSKKTGTAYMNYVGSKVNASIALGTTSLSGYNFRGWSTDSAANAKITIAANGTASINASTTYYASYTYGITATLKTYNNKTSTKTGSAYMSYNGTKANGTINLGTTSLSGYTFRGWSTKTEANASITVQPNGNANIQANTTFYASYSYTVTATLKTYNNKTSSKTGTAYMNYVGSKVNASIALGTTSLSGYTFRGWSTDSAANAKITIAANGTASINANTTYYASYTYGITATLKTYNNNTTTKTGSAYMSYNGTKVNGTINLGTTSLSGYTFRGWSTSNAANASITVKANGNASIQANTTFYASYTYTVTATYKYYNGSAYTTTTANATAYMNYVGVKIGAKPTVPSVKTPSGWTNRGWSTSESVTGQVATPGNITSNRTYYYSWKKTVTITLRIYNNTSSSKTRTAYLNYAGKTTNASINLGTHSVSGYTFRGWSTSDTANASINVKANGSVSTASNATYYGSYNYTVTATYKYYNGSAYTTTTANASAFMNYTGQKVGAKPTVPSVKTPSGWTNRGWSTNSSANASTVTPGTITSNTTYYYSWQKNVKVTFNLNGGSGTAPAAQTKTAYLNYAGTATNPSFTLPSSSTSKTGYNFDRWNTNPSGTGTNYAANQSVKFGSNITLYAKWKAKTIVVTFMRNTSSGDTVKATQTFTYGVAGQKFSAKGWTRDEYDMIGWNSNRNATTMQYYTLSEVGDSWIDSHAPSYTVYAIWRDNSEPSVEAEPTKSTKCGDNYLVNGKQHKADTYLKTKITASDPQSGIKKIEIKIRGNYWGQVYTGHKDNVTEWNINYNIGKDKADTYYVDVTVTNGVDKKMSATYGPYIFYGWQDRRKLASATPGTYVTGNDYYVNSDGTYLTNSWILTSGHLYWLNEQGTYTRRHYASASESDPNYMNNFTTTINGHDYRVRSYGSVVAYGQEYVNEKIESQDFVNKYKGWMRLYHPGGGYSWAYSKGSLGNGWGYHDFYYNNRYLRIGSDTYAFHKNGFMASDEWVNYNGAWYYARDWGGFLHNQSMYITRKDYSFDGDPKRTINAATYQFDSSGRCTNFYSYN